MGRTLNARTALTLGTLGGNVSQSTSLQIPVFSRHGKPINILFIILGKTEASFYFHTAGEGPRGASTIGTATGLQEVQHSQLSNHKKEVMTLVQQSTAMLQTQRFRGCGGPPKPQELDLRTAERGCIFSSQAGNAVLM